MEDNLMNKEINPEILKRINKVNKGNVKNFLKEALKVEYSVRDMDKPRVKEKYTKLIDKYYGEFDDY